MVEIGYALSSEEHPPRDLVRDAQAAEAAGLASHSFRITFIRGSTVRDIVHSSGRSLVRSPNNEQAQAGNWRHLSNGALPPGNRRAGGSNVRGADAWQIFPGPGLGRKSE